MKTPGEMEARAVGNAFLGTEPFEDYLQVLLIFST